MSTDLARLEDRAEWPSSLAVSRAPQVVLREAHEAAAALKDVIDSKPKRVEFNGETYLEFEDWQTVGRFYGIAPRITGTRYVEFGEAKGWEATAEALHVESGKIVSSADAMCLDDEEKWRARPKYAYVYHKRSGGTSVEDPGKDELIWEKGADGKSRPKKERVRVADEPVPLFQLRSMAQTRAGSKALRNALAWVVVLAGYRPTPAEELDAREVPQTPRVVAEAEPPRTDDEQASDLFPTPEEELRKLRASIQAGWLVLGWDEAKRLREMDQHFGGADNFDLITDPAALQDYLTKLRAEHKQSGKRRTSV